MKVLLTPLHLLYGGITESRNWLYERGQLKSNEVGRPVIGVGNITAGGTGKTPLVSSLLSWATKEGLRAGVVSRGYKGKFDGVEKVDPNRKDAAEYYGDEPTLLAKKFLDVPVFVGAKRVEVAKKMIESCDVDFIIADDAFQHRALNRNIDIVVIDALELRENYQMLPTGRLREPLHNLRRADYVVLSRSNLASKSQLEWTQKMLADNGISKDQVIHAQILIKSITQIGGNPHAASRGDTRKRAFLFSGIGSPESFELLMAHEYDIAGVRVFRDHHTFSTEDVQSVLKTAREAGADIILTTEKDAVKLNGLIPFESEAIFAVEIESRFSNSIEKLWNEIASLAR